jgi:secreted trypsin-like serine protease
VLVHQHIQRRNLNTPRTWLTGLASAGLALTATITVNPSPAAATADGGPAVMIVGGGDASEAYPFGARILTSYPELGGAVTSCTATLVEDRGAIKVVTAAQCVSDRQTGAAKAPADITVQVGATRLDRLTDITPTAVAVHPDWDWATGDNKVADIAVLKIPAHPHLRGIPIGQVTSPGRRVRTLGWGKTSTDATTPSAVLQQLDTTIVEPGTCASQRIGVDEFCVQGVAGAAACQGDGGGPALSRVHGRWVVLGGASRTTDQVHCGGAAVYTSAVYYKTWIRRAFTAGQPHRPHRVAPGAATRYLSRVH